MSLLFAGFATKIDTNLPEVRPLFTMECWVEFAITAGAVPMLVPFQKGRLGGPLSPL